MDFSLRQLRHFEALYRHKNYSLAALELSISQPALTKSINSLEATLGYRLFKRNTHQVIATRSADKLIDTARTILADIKRFSKQATRISQSQLGQIAIGAGPFALEPLLSNTITQLDRQSAKLEITIRTGERQSLLDGLLNRSLDMVVSESGKFDTLPFADRCEHIILYDEPIVILHNREHPISGKPLSQLDLTQYDWALPQTSLYYQRYIQRLSGNSQRQKIPSIRYHIDMPHLCAQLACNSQILSAAPLSFAKLFCQNQPTLANLSYTILPADFRTRTAVHILKDAAPSPAVTACIEALKACHKKIIDTL